MNIEIANRLVQLRKQYGYSQEELAARLGISRQAVSKWERAESSPDTDNLIMLSRLYGVSLDSLLATDEEIPQPEPEQASESQQNAQESADDAGVHAEDGGVRFGKGGDSVYIGAKGIHVESEDGETVHIGWDGIHVNDGASRVNVDHGGVDVDEDGSGDGDTIKNVRADESGVYFTENGEERFCEYNDVRDGRRRYVRKKYDEKRNRWQTLIINDRGKKVVVTSEKEPKHIHKADWGDSVSFNKSDAMSGFPFVAIITAAFLLLGFIGGWWHPAWLLFLTIPVYYPLVRAIRRGGVSPFDVIVPVIIGGAYVAIGFIWRIWSPTWLMLLAIPVYFIISAIFRKSLVEVLAKGWYPIFVTAVYFVLGFVLGKAGWSMGCLLYFTIPLYYSVIESIKKHRGVKALTAFPWEVLIVGLYLFAGIMYGWWHPGWVIFLLIPVLRWILSAIVKSVRKGADADTDTDTD